MTSPTDADPPRLFTGSFALGTLSAPDEAAFPGLVVPDGRVLDLCAALDDPGLTIRTLLDRWDEMRRELPALADDPSHPWHRLTGLRVHAPVRPRQVFQAGANYRQHVIDLALAHRPKEDQRTEARARAEMATLMDRRAAQDLPYVFTGLPTAIGGPYDDVLLPAWAAQPDWELELAAVIGRPARRVHRDVALSYVAGYTIVNDITTRDRVYRPDIPGIGTDWLASKNAPTFLPTGPYLVPAAFIDDPMKLRIVLRLNGETMQDACTAEMIFDIARLIEYASSLAELLPGDLLLTGSPAGNGVHYRRFLRPGDVMEGEITELGKQRNRCVAEQPAATPFRP